MAKFYSYSDGEIKYIHGDRIDTKSIESFIDDLYRGGAYSFQRNIAAGLIEHILNMPTAGEESYVLRAKRHKQNSGQTEQKVLDG